MRQNRVHLMPPMSNFYARICVKATPSSNTRRDKWGYLTELRDSIVKRLLANEIQYKDAVSEYGIPIHNLYKWVSKARAGARSEDVRFFVSRR